jgi:hypothetical protein
MRRLAGLAALLASIALGVALYATPDVLGLAAGARANWLVVGPLAAAAATISLSPVARSTVRVNVLLGAWLVVAPLELDYGKWWWLGIACGLVLAALALLPPNESDRFAGGWWAVIRSSTEQSG